MAIEGVKPTGGAYQGSSPKPVTETAKAENVSAGTGTEQSGLTDSSSVKWSSQELKIDGGKDVAEGKSPVPTEALKKAVEEINKRNTNSEAEFGIHEETNRVTIKIVDKDSHKVLKEFPPEKTLDMIAKVWELAGLLVDEKR